MLNQTTEYTPLVQSLLNYGIAPNDPINASILPTTGVAETSMWDMDSILGNAKTGQTGWAPTALNAISGLTSAWLGMKQYGLAKDQFKESKRQFNMNFDAQKNLTNSRLEDRQRARIASNPNAYRSVGEYMGTYGVK